MADNVDVTPGAGATIGTDDVGGVQYQVVKIGVGADGVMGLVTLANPLPVGVAVRNDADGVPLVPDSFPSPLMTDEGGRLKVSTKPATYDDITGGITAIQATIGTPVAGGTVAGDVSRASNIMAFCTGTFNTVNCAFEGSLESSGDTNWFGLQAVRSNANTIETTTGNLSAQPAYSWEMSVNALKRVRVRCTARTSGTQSWRFVQGTYATEPIPAAQISGTQPISGTVTANLGTITTPTALKRNSTADTNLVSVKASAGTIYAAQAFNSGATAAYLKLYNKASAPVLASDVPVIVLPIPAGTDHMRNWSIPGDRFGTGIAMAITGLPADTDTTAVAAAQVKANISYI